MTVRDAWIRVRLILKDRSDKSKMSLYLAFRARPKIMITVTHATVIVARFLSVDTHFLKDRRRK